MTRVRADYVYTCAYVMKSADKPVLNTNLGAVLGRCSAEGARPIVYFCEHE